MVGGFAALRVMTDYESVDSFHQNIRITAIADPTQAFFDPAAQKPDKSDGRFCGVYHTMTIDEFERRYPDQKDIHSFQTDYRDRHFTWQSDKTVTIAEYFVKIFETKKMVQLSTGEVVDANQAKQILAEHADITIVSERDAEDYHILNYQLTREAILEKNEWPSKDLPIIFVDGDSFYREGQQITKSFIHYAKDAQRYLNYIASEAALAVLNRRREEWLATPENIKNNEEAWKYPDRVQGAMIFTPDSRTGFIPQKIPPSEISATLMAQYERAKQDIKQILGRYEANLGMPGNEHSGVAILFGHIGDKFGRKQSILITLMAMSVSTLLIALLPTYSVVGMSASIILVILRLIQGLASSGEHSGVICFISEIPFSGKRFFYTSLCFAAVMLGMQLGMIITSLLWNLFSEDQLLSYGWRVPFFIGSIFGVICLLIMLRVTESLEFTSLKNTKGVYKLPFIESLKFNKRKISIVVGMFCFNSVIFYSIFVYLPIHFIVAHSVNGKSILWINSANVLIMTMLIFFFSSMADKFGPWIFLKMGSIGMIIMSYPLLLIMDRGEIPSFFIAQSLAGVFNAMFLAPTPLLYTELFQCNIRYSSVAMGINLSAAIFGGTAPLLMALLGKLSNHLFFESLYLSGFSLVAFISAFFLKKQVILRHNQPVDNKALHHV